MCLIAWNWQPGSATPLLLIANRDEFYARPTAALHAWPETGILAGRDLQAGGTWLGVSRSGRLAALTNHRDATRQRDEAPSRGELVSGFLSSNLSAGAYLKALSQSVADYNPFNLLVYDGSSLLGLESHHARIVTMKPGVGAVSNANFQTPWPKLTRLTAGLQQLVSHGQPDDAQLLTLLQNPQPASDADLPQTGLPLPLERVLSAIFIASANYGTRASSVVRFEADRMSLLEQGFDAAGPIHTLTLTANRQAD